MALPIPVPAQDPAGPGPGVIPAPVPVPPQAAPVAPIAVPTPPVAVPPVPAAAPPGAAPIANGNAPVPDPVQLAADTATGTKQLGDDEVKLAADKSKAEAEQAAAKQQFDEQHAKLLDQYLKEQQSHRASADQEIAAKRQQYEAAPYHSLWSTRSTGQKAAIALGILAGGVSWNSNHVNRAVQLLQDAETEDFNRQKEVHADLWRDLQLSLDNRKELDGRQLHELADWQTQEAAKWQATASKLNGMLAGVKGRGEQLEARKVALEAQEKANTAYSNARSALATAKHMDAQSRLTDEEVKNQPGIRDKNAAEAAKFRAEAANNNAMAANGGLDKFSQQLITRIPTMLQRDQDVKVLYGNDATPGPLRVLPRVAQLQDDIKAGIASGDQAKVMQSVIAAKELTSKLLTGGQLNETKAKVFDSIQGNPAEVQAKLSRLLGDPKASEQLVHGVYGLLDDVREQNLKLTDDARTRLRKRHLDPKNPMTRNPAVRGELENQIESLTSEVKNGGGTPRYGEGGAAPAGPKMVTIKNAKTGETKQVTEAEAKQLGAL